ncbi:unnamed protein product, partial [marine sediment metagenome]
LYCLGSSPKIESCVFSDNMTEGFGGAIFLDDNSSPEIKSCQFTGNTAPIFGGAIYCSLDSNPIIGGTSVSGNYFSGNFAPSGADLSRGCTICNERSQGSAIEFFVESPESEDQDCLRTPVDATYNTFEGYFPSDYYVSLMEEFNLDNCTSELTPVTQDVYVSISGNDQNEGLTWNTAFLTLQHAFSVVYGTESNPVTIHLGAGTYSPAETGELYPLPLLSYVSIAGQDSSTTILNAEHSDRCIYSFSDENITISDLSITGGESTHGAGLTSMGSAFTI